MITITHLPQIASLADRHFRVEKVPGDPTHTRIEPLEADERREELERMLGGADFLATLGSEWPCHARAPRLARGRLGVPRRAVPPLRLVARDRQRRARPARLRDGRSLAGQRDRGPVPFRPSPLPAGRPADRAQRGQTLVITAIEPGTAGRSSSTAASRRTRPQCRAAHASTVLLRPLADDRTEVEVEVASGLAREPDLARTAADRLYDLVQTAAAL